MDDTSKIGRVMSMEQKHEETDNTTKNLVHEIVRECNAHNIELYENFCTYYVKLLILDPHWQISPERKLNRIYIQQLVSFIIKKLQLKNCPSLAALRMQQAFRSQVVDKETLVTNYRNLMRTIVEPLGDNVLHYIPDENNKIRLFKRMVLLIAFAAFIGHWKNMPLILKDTSTALRSVMDEYEFVEFIEMKPEERFHKIHFYSLVVMGIRLFHHDAGRQLSDFQDIPKIINRDLGSVQGQLKSQLEIATERINLATNAIRSVFECKYEKDKDNPDHTYYCMRMKLPEGVTPEDVEYTCDFLVMAAQYEVYLRKTSDEVNKIGIASDIYSKHHREILAKLNSIIKFNIGVAATTVFPIFMELAQTWSKIQDEFLVLAIYLQLFKKLCGFFTNEFCNLDLWQTMIANKPIKRNKMSVTEDDVIKGPLVHCALYSIDKLTAAEKSSISFLGFCAWTLVETKGALIPGNSSMGVLKWKKNFYTFAVLEAAYIFDRDPEKLLMASYEIIRKKPELINLLKVYDNIYAVRNVEELCPKVKLSKKIISNSTQTEVHPIPSTIDSNYIWNEWDFYRDAIKLADISECKTNSTQTKYSHFKCETAVQTTEPRTKGCQTKCDNYSNVETLSNYIFGLRGYKDNRQHVIELTRPINEKMYHACAAKNLPAFEPPLKKCISKKTKRNEKLTSKISISTSSSDQTKQQSDTVEDLNSCLCINKII